MKGDVRTRAADPPSLNGHLKNSWRWPERGEFRLNRHPALMICFERVDLAKPVPTFAGHALDRVLLSGRQLIEREVEQQNIDPRLAQEPEQAAFGLVRDELADAIFGQIARLGNTGNLEKRGFG